MEKSFIFLKCQVCLVYPRRNEVHEQFIIILPGISQQLSKKTALATYTGTRGEDKVQQGTSMCTTTGECWNKWPNTAP